MTKTPVPLNLALIKTLYKPRATKSHKGDFGHALLVAGNTGKMGAAVISARACERTGAGLTSVACAENVQTVLHTTVPEAMCVTRENIHEVKYTTVGIGPGMGTSAEELLLLKAILHQNTNAKLVLDADALTLLSANADLLKKVPAGTILTPHIKEFDRLFGNFTNEEQRLFAAKTFCGNTGAIIVLKNDRTHIISANEVFINNATGNSGLAKGGSGDALTGIITALLAQKYLPTHAAVLGVYLHALAADIAVKEFSPESLLATDVVEKLGAAFRFIAATD